MRKIESPFNLSWNIHIPNNEYTTDNAAMIAISGYYKYLNSDFVNQKITPYPRMNPDKFL